MSPRNALNGAQVIVDYLIQEKVPQVFGLCGHGNIQFIDALYERSDELKTISVHHESVAGFMADVYYRVSGRPTATFTSCGPGSANLPISLGNAFLDSVPFLAVTGNVPTSQFNRGAFQETYRQYQADFPSTVKAYCKRVFQPTRGEMVPLAIRQAWKTMMTGRPGPVVLDVPFDIFKEAAGEDTPKPEEWNANISSRCGADPEGVVKAVDMLLSAERPVIIVGQGVRYGGAADDLLQLAELLNIPVAASASGLGAIDTKHPLSVGLVARNGHYQANHATRQADVLLALGVPRGVVGLIVAVAGHKSDRKRVLGVDGAQSAGRSGDGNVEQFGKLQQIVRRTAIAHALADDDDGALRRQQHVDGFDHAFRIGAAARRYVGIPLFRLRRVFAGGFLEDVEGNVEHHRSRPSGHHRLPGLANCERHHLAAGRLEHALAIGLH